MPVSSESNEERRRKQAAKIAQSRAAATPIQQATPMQAAPLASSGPSKLQQVGGQLAKSALGSALGPLGGILGGLFNQGGKVDYAEEARKRVAAQNAALKAGAKGQTVAPKQRHLFTADTQGKTLSGADHIGQVSGDAIKGYAKREKFRPEAGVDPFEGISQQIAAQKAAGKPVDYQALAALQHARSAGNEQAKQEAMRAFLKKYPEFSVPGASQGVVLRTTNKNEGGMVEGYNGGGSVEKKKKKTIWDKFKYAAGVGYEHPKGSLADQINFGRKPEKKNVGGMVGPLNPNGYNAGGAVQETPMKRVMDEDKIELARMAAMKAEERKDMKFKADEMRAQEKHMQDMKMKKAAATTNKAPLAK